MAEEEEMQGRENYEEDMEHVSDIRTVFGISSTAPKAIPGKRNRGKRK